MPQWKYFGVSRREQITTKNALLVSFGYNYLKFQADKAWKFCQQNMIWYTGLSLTDTRLICILGFRNIEHSTHSTLLPCCITYNTAVDTQRIILICCDLLWHRRKKSDYMIYHERSSLTFQLALQTLCTGQRWLLFLRDKLGRRNETHTQYNTRRELNTT